MIRKTDSDTNSPHLRKKMRSYPHSKKSRIAKEKNMTAEYQVVLKQHEVREFVRAAEGCECDVTIQAGDQTVDAKSLSGVLSLNFRNPVRVQTSEVDPVFDSYMHRYAIA